MKIRGQRVELGEVEAQLAEAAAATLTYGATISTSTRNTSTDVGTTGGSSGSGDASGKSTVAPAAASAAVQVAVRTAASAVPTVAVVCVEMANRMPGTYRSSGSETSNSSSNDKRQVLVGMVVLPETSQPCFLRSKHPSPNPG